MIRHSIVIPVFNEELLIQESYTRLKKVLDTVGEYIGRIYKETKNRPLYIVRNKIGFN